MMFQKQVSVPIIWVTYFSNSVLCTHFCMFLSYFMLFRYLCTSCSYLFHIFSPFSLPLPSQFYHSISYKPFLSLLLPQCLVCSLLQSFLLFLPPPHPASLIVFCHPAFPAFHFNVFTLFCLPLAYLFLFCTFLHSAPILCFSLSCCLLPPASQPALLRAAVI